MLSGGSRMLYPYVQSEAAKPVAAAVGSSSPAGAAAKAAVGEYKELVDETLAYSFRYPARTAIML